MPAPKKTAAKADKAIKIQTVKRGKLQAHIVGTSPLILHCMSMKARQELLWPTPAGKARRSGMKHNPLEEFRASVYYDRNAKADTFLQGLASWFKAGMVGATVDMPDASKAGIGRNIWVTGQRVSLYGVPELFMAITRSAGMNRTPDVRTRAILPEWACTIEIDFASPQLTAKAVGELLATAGIVMGVGDWRPEKGSGNYGQFKVVSEKDRTHKRITSTMGRAVQLEAMKEPAYHDDETAELMSWFTEELERRGNPAA